MNYIASEWTGICFSFIHLISFASGSHVTGVIHAVKEMCLRCFNKNMHVWGQSLYIQCELMLLYDILLCGCSVLTVDNAAKCAPNCGWPAVVVTVMPQICPFHLMQHLHRHLFPFCAPPEETRLAALKHLIWRHFNELRRVIPSWRLLLIIGQIWCIQVYLWWFLIDVRASYLQLGNGLSREKLQDKMYVPRPQRNGACNPTPAAGW